MHGMYGGYGYPMYGGFWVVIAWIVQLVIGYFVYLDAKQRGMNPVLWFILVILPMIGWLFLVLYIIIRETGRPAAGSEKSATAILDERFARGEITAEEYRKMKDELNR